MLRLAIQKRLERGHPSVALDMLARVWEETARVEARLTSRLPVLCVGGATLGGSGRTPLAVACARELSRRLRVVLVGHAYRARAPELPHVVHPDDDVSAVGDEALDCARLLADTTARVVVARDRQRAMDAVTGDADVIILDGPLQLASRRATLSLLAVAAGTSWANAGCPPRGDLRASRLALERAADRVISIGVSGDATPRSNGAHMPVPMRHALLSFADLRAMRVGLATGIGHPERVVAFLRDRGIEPRRVLRVANHSRLVLHGALDLDVWLITGKDAARTASARLAPPLAILDYHLDLPSGVCDLLTSRF